MNNRRPKRFGGQTPDLGILLFVFAVCAFLPLLYGKSGISTETVIGGAIAIALLIAIGVGAFSLYDSVNRIIDMHILSHLSDGREYEDHAIVSALKRKKWIYKVFHGLIIGRLSSLVKNRKIIIVKGRYCVREMDYSNALPVTSLQNDLPAQDNGRKNQFDVFLSHNSKDKPDVRKLALALANREIRVWLDETHLVPGRPWQEALEEIIENTNSAAVLVGADGIGPWELPEMRGCLDEFVRRNMPVIPVLLPNAGDAPQLPLFLRQFTWVDLRKGLVDDGLERLIWGITGKTTGQSN